LIITTHLISGLSHNTNVSGISFEIKFVYSVQRYKGKGNDIYISNIWNISMY